MVGLLRNAIRFVVVYGVGGIVGWLAIEAVKAGITDPRVRDWVIAAMVPLVLILMTVSFCVWIWRGEKRPSTVEPMTKEASGHPVALKMPQWMTALHEEGLFRLDELRAMATHREDAYTRRRLEEWFTSWDQRLGDAAHANGAGPYWGQWGGDPGWLAHDLSAFSEWVQQMGQAVDQRLYRLRWIVNGAVGFMP